MKYIKKPVVIEAHIWDEKKSTLERIGCDFSSHSGHTDRPDECTNLRINTKEGVMHVNPWDYIIREPFDTERKFYPCKPDIFKQTYDKIED